MFAQSTKIWDVPQVSQELTLTVEEFKNRHPQISLSFIAQSLGVSPASVSAWNRGLRSQTLRTKKQLGELHKRLVSGDAYL